MSGVMEKKGIDDYELGPLPSPRQLEKFGVVKRVFDNPSERSSKFREEKRKRRWRKMIGLGGSEWKHYARRKSHVVKRRIRKGIPYCLKGLVGS